MNNDIEIYYQKALHFVKSHYENFPVISLFITKELRKHVAIVYQFARQADDLADEGTQVEESRIKELEKYENDFSKSLQSIYVEGFWLALNNTIIQRNISNQHFYNLLKAFKQDIYKKRYKNFDELLCYCENSANPVGQIILELHEIREELAFSYSDKICTALQLTNFYQDVAIDIEKERIYIPLNELSLFGVTEKDIEEKRYTENFVNLMKYQVDRTKKLFEEGRNLLEYLPIRLRFQILVTIKGGETILKKIIYNNYNVLDKRPTISKLEFIKLFISSILLWK